MYFIFYLRNNEKINLPTPIKPFFDRRVEKRSLSGAKPRLFKEVYRKMVKSDGKFIFLSFLKLVFKHSLLITLKKSESIKFTAYLC